MDRRLKIVLSVRLFTDEKCFGPGVAELLHRVEQLRSLRAAAMDMSMAYSKAWTIVKNAERELGFKLLDSTTGGRHGGGAVLTAEGFITKRHYGRVQLTGEGIWAANQLHTKCMLLESFLAEELAVAEEVAHRDAVACLCSLSEESIERIVRRVLPGNAVMLRAVGE